MRICVSVPGTVLWMPFSCFCHNLFLCCCCCCCCLLFLCFLLTLLFSFIYCLAVDRKLKCFKRERKFFVCLGGRMGVSVRVCVCVRAPAHMCTTTIGNEFNKLIDTLLLHLKIFFFTVLLYVGIIVKSS